MKVIIITSSLSSAHSRTNALVRDSLITERQSLQLRVRHGVFSYNHHFRYPLILIEKLRDILLVNITDRLDAFLGQTGATFRDNPRKVKDLEFLRRIPEQDFINGFHKLYIMGGETLKVHAAYFI